MDRSKEEKIDNERKLRANWEIVRMDRTESDISQ